MKVVHIFLSVCVLLGFFCGVTAGERKWDKIGMGVYVVASILLAFSVITNYAA